MEEQKKKPSFWKRKVIGIPIFMFIIMGIVFVIALATYISYHQEFTTTLNLFNIGSGEDNSENIIQIIGFGAIGDSNISCGVSGNNGICTLKSGNIYLINPDIISHTCTISTNFNNNVNISYIEDNNQTILNGVKDIPANSTMGFNIIYRVSGIGSYPMTTIINCPV